MRCKDCGKDHDTTNVHCGLRVAVENGVHVDPPPVLQRLGKCPRALRLEALLRRVLLALRDIQEELGND